MFEQIEITTEMILNTLRINRNIILDNVIKYNTWIYERYNREIRLGITPTSNTADEIYELDFYIQELCDLPEKYKNVTSYSDIVFPTPPNFVRGI